MATTGMGFNIQDKASVEAWKDRAQTLNEKAAQVVREAAEVLEAFRDTAEGQIFEQVVTYSNDVIQGMKKVFEGMNQVLEVVNSLMESAMRVIQELVTGVKTTGNKVVG